MGVLGLLDGAGTAIWLISWDVWTSGRGRDLPACYDDAIAHVVEVAAP